MRLNAVLGVAAFAGVALTATPALGATTVFRLVNHPNGAVDPQLYGLRLDEFGGDDPATFSFLDRNTGASNVTLTLADNGGGNWTLNLNGTVWGNSATGGTDFGVFAVDATYQMTGSFASGFETTQTGMIGTLTETVSTTAAGQSAFSGTVLDLDASNAKTPTFNFKRGHRLPSGDDRFVGWGWLDTLASDNTEDWLFVGQPIPLPTPLGLGACGLLGLAGLRRRRA